MTKAVDTHYSAPTDPRTFCGRINYNLRGTKEWDQVTCVRCHRFRMSRDRRVKGLSRPPKWGKWILLALLLGGASARAGTPMETCRAQRYQLVEQHLECLQDCPYEEYYATVQKPAPETRTPEATCWLELEELRKVINWCQSRCLTARGAM